MRAALKVFYENEALNDPYVVVLELGNPGRADITSGSFDKGRGVVLDLGAPVIKVLGIEYTPWSAPAPIIVNSGTTIELRPELIVAGELIKIFLLAEGAVTGIALTLNPLSNANIDIKDRDAWVKRGSTRRAAVAICAVTALLILVTTSLVALAQDHGQQTRYNLVSARGLACDNLVLSMAEQEDAAARTFDDIKNESLGQEYRLDLVTVHVDNSLLGLAYATASGLGVPLNRTDDLLSMVRDEYEALLRLPKDHSSLERNRDLAAAQRFGSDQPLTQATAKECYPYETADQWFK
jgi:hypothetical protein